MEPSTRQFFWREAYRLAYERGNTSDQAIKEADTALAAYDKVGAHAPPKEGA